MDNAPLYVYVYVHIYIYIYIYMYTIPFQSPYHPEGGVGGGLIVPKVSSESPSGSLYRKMC